MFIIIIYHLIFSKINLHLRLLLLILLYLYIPILSFLVTLLADINILLLLLLLFITSISFMIVMNLIIEHSIINRLSVYSSHYIITTLFDIYLPIIHHMFVKTNVSICSSVLFLLYYHLLLIYLVFSSPLFQVAL